MCAVMLDLALTPAVAAIFAASSTRKRDQKRPAKSADMSADKGKLKKGPGSCEGLRVGDVPLGSAVERAALVTSLVLGGVAKVWR